MNWRCTCHEQPTAPKCRGDISQELRCRSHRPRHLHFRARGLSLCADVVADAAITSNRLRGNRICVYRRRPPSFNSRPVDLRPRVLVGIPKSVVITDRLPASDRNDKAHQRANTSTHTAEHRDVRAMWFAATFSRDHRSLNREARPQSHQRAKEYRMTSRPAAFAWLLLTRGGRQCGQLE